MKFSVDKQEKYCIFKMEEDKLNSVCAPHLKSELVLLNAEGIRNIILDLEGVRYIDSSGLSAILVGNRLCREANGSFICAAMNETGHKLIKISQLESIIQCIPTISESVDYVMMEEVERDFSSED